LGGGWFLKKIEKQEGRRYVNWKKKGIAYRTGGFVNQEQKITKERSTVKITGREIQIQFIHKK